MKLPHWQGQAGDLLSLVAGATLPLAFAPFSWFFLAPLSIAVLFLFWQDVSPRRAFLRGFLYGMSLFGIGISWIYISFSYFGGLPMLGALAITLGFVAFMSLYPAFLGWGIARFFPQTTPAKLFLTLPVAWTLVEWFRGWFLTGFPWLSLGYSQINSFLSGFAPVFGVYGVSWATACTAGLLVYLWRGGSVIFVSILLISLWGGGSLLTPTHWCQPIDQPLQVALVQGNIPQEFKWLTSYQFPSMYRYLRLSQEHRDVDLIVWPETAIPLFYHEVPTFLEQVVTESNEYKTDFLIGIPVLEKDGQTYFNAVTSVSMQPGFYYKRHLVPFGEYIPLSQITGNLLRLLDIPFSEFSGGTFQQPNLYAAKQPVGVSICYEDAFGELIRTSLPQATLLVNVSNDAWFGRSIAPHQHLEIAQMRALESGRYLLRATNTGISAVIDVQGKIVARVPQFEITTLRATAQPYQGTTPYIRLGNWLLISLLTIAFLIGIIGQRYRWLYF